jgi:photosystem II stability/assembly factor-like uncharacterized protein
MKTKLLIVVFAVLLLNLISPASKTFCQWIWQNPLPVGCNLLDVEFENAYTGYCYGYLGIFIKTTNSGNNWFIMNHDGRKIYGFCVSGPGSLVAASDSGYLMKSTNGGNNWIIINSGLSDVWLPRFLNSTTGWAAGAGPSILKTTNSGFNWSIYNFGFMNSSVTSYCFLNQNTGYLTTYYYVYSPPNPVYDSRVYRTYDGGMNWVQQFSQVGYTGINFGCIQFFNPDTGIVLDKHNSSISKSTNAGINWNSIYSESIINCKFYNHLTGYAAGGFYTYGRILKTTNGGYNWIIQLNNNPRVITNIYLRDSVNCWATGSSGTMFMTTNGGINWINKISGFRDNVMAIKFLNENTGWVAGLSGLIAKTTNGGNQWVVKTSGTLNNLLSVYFVNSLTGWITGMNGDILKTYDGGENWGYQESNTTSHLNASFFINESTGWAAGHAGTVRRTTNGGLNWLSCNLPSNDSIFAVQFFNNNTGYMIAKNRYFYKTTNGGVNWTSHLVNYNTDYYAMHFLNDNSGWVAGPNGICKTINGGENWIMTSLIGSFRCIYFFNPQYGIAAGNTYYRTTDGGLNWISQTSLGFKIKSLFFVNNNTGWLAGDNGSIVKSTNAGLTYTNKIIDEIPKTYVLQQNYPNPFNPSSIIGYQLPANNFVKLVVYDITGREVQTLVNGQLRSGTYEVTFDGSGLNSGVYFYKLTAGDFSETKRMVLIK